MSALAPLLMPASLAAGLTETIRDRFPQKSFGYLISDSASNEPRDFVLFESNIRNDEEWQPQFHTYGRYFVEHDDAGFVATPEESWRAQKEIWARGMFEIGVFHSHQRHPANFSQIDYELHTRRFPSLWHLIISLRNPDLPQLRAFDVTGAGVRELPIVLQPPDRAVAR